MKDMPIESNISFADSSIKSFRFEEDINCLFIKLELWNSRNIELKCFDSIFFQYSPGDFVSNIYTCQDDLSLLSGVVKREFEKMPENHPYKLFEIRDIYDFPVIKVVASKIEIVTFE